MTATLPPTQQTLAAAVELAGRGLFHGRPVRLRCRPAPAAHGIVFQRVDLPGAPRVSAAIASLATTDRATALRAGAAAAVFVEHLLAAAAGLGVDNLLVELDAPELPALDGSAADYAAAFRAAGLVAQAAPRRRFRPREPIILERDGARLALAPADGLTIHYALDYGDRFLKRQELTLAVTPATFVDEIAPARTMVLRPEIQAFLDRGLGGGATADNVVIIEEDGRSATPLRFPDECVRHKMLDLLGDLALAGVMPEGRITACRSGHALNVELARRIAAAAGARA